MHFRHLEEAEREMEINLVVKDDMTATNRTQSKQATQHTKNWTKASTFKGFLCSTDMPTSVEQGIVGELSTSESDVFVVGIQLRLQCRFDDALEVFTKGLESSDTELKCKLALKHVELSKRVAVAFDASKVEIFNLLTDNNNSGMLKWLEVHENEEMLKEVKSSPYKFKATHARMEETLKIFEDVLKKDPPVQTTKVSQVNSGGDREGAPDGPQSGNKVENGLCVVFAEDSITGRRYMCV
ncbi:Aste57867_22777 [Aphanomyces stellatus]|uniref:Aste57867_22777 protein n=1 Tax=Aphanomyces stellatus TaxID=120398 RepID=A0A485LL23_9STRA|nr:hypothetical protein As57867_022707 [Aphanomyces stellatus]VFT99430.1 Aste57867_22777 [Aphanomyces stellatus]